MGAVRHVSVYKSKLKTPFVIITMPTMAEANLPIVCRAPLSLAIDMSGSGSMYTDDPMKNMTKVIMPSDIVDAPIADVAVATIGGQAFIAEMNPNVGTYICGACWRTRFFMPFPLAQRVGSFTNAFANIKAPASSEVVATKFRVCHSTLFIKPMASAIVIYAMSRPPRNFPRYAYAPIVVGAFFMMTDTTSGPHEAKHDAPTLNPISNPSIIFFDFCLNHVGKETSLFSLCKTCGIYRRRVCDFVPKCGFWDEWQAPFWDEWLMYCCL